MLGPFEMKNTSFAPNICFLKNISNNGLPAFI
jgi:hypothetical protein